MSNRKNKLLVGITGGIGSGKSLLSKYLQSKGEFVIYSDALAKKIMTNDASIKEQLMKTFGSKTYTPEGELNTSYLAENIYSDLDKYRKINSIIHPPTMNEILRLAQKEFKKRDLVFVESALIFEANLEKKFDYIILVKSDVSLRLKRIVERDGIPPNDFFRRAQHQIDPDIAEELADFTIHNNSTIEDLYPNFDFILNILAHLSKAFKKSY